MSFTTKEMWLKAAGRNKTAFDIFGGIVPRIYDSAKLSRRDVLPAMSTSLGTVVSLFEERALASVALLTKPGRSSDSFFVSAGRRGACVLWRPTHARDVCRSGISSYPCAHDPLLQGADVAPLRGSAPRPYAVVIRYADDVRCSELPNTIRSAPSARQLFGTCLRCPNLLRTELHPSCSSLHASFNEPNGRPKRKPWRCRDPRGSSSRLGAGRGTCAEREQRRQDCWLFRCGTAWTTDNAAGAFRCRPVPQGTPGPRPMWKPAGKCHG